MKEQEEAKFMKEENQKRMNQLARQALIDNGNLYLNKYGEKKIELDLEELRKQIAHWNMVGETSVRVNIDTVTLMISALASIPVLIGKMEILADPKFGELNIKLCAIRNFLIKQRSETIARNNPGLSTP